MNNKPILVAQVIGMAINGGTESLWMNYYRHIDRNLVQFDFLVESESKIINKEEIEALGGHVIIIPSYKNPFKYMKELTRIFKEKNYDIVHSNMSTLSVFTLRAAKKAGIKVRIAHSHSTSNKKEWKKNLLKNLLRPFSKIYATHYFACSELAGRYLFGNKTFNNGLVTIINNAIDIERFKFNEYYRSEIRKELGVLDDEIIVGNIGRMQQQKNQTFLIDIFKEYYKINKKSKLLIIGDGPLKDELEKKTCDLGIPNNVIFAGIMANPEKYYSAMDCFVLPSLYEGLPVVGVEAQINGVPLILSDTITRELKLSMNVKYLSINSKPLIWSNIISEFSGNYVDRENAYLAFKNTKYDISATAEKIATTYFELIKESN